jgi:hypothetical protein
LSVAARLAAAVSPFLAPFFRDLLGIGTPRSERGVEPLHGDQARLQETGSLEALAAQLGQRFELSEDDRLGPLEVEAGLPLLAGQQFGAPRSAAWD